MKTFDLNIATTTGKPIRDFRNYEERCFLTSGQTAMWYQGKGHGRTLRESAAADDSDICFLPLVL
jgi:hypothetical protein